MEKHNKPKPKHIEDAKQININFNESKEDLPVEKEGVEELLTEYDLEAEEDHKHEEEINKLKEASEEVIAFIKKLNLKYPKAKLNPLIVKSDNQGGYIISGMHFTSAEMEEYIKGLDELENNDGDYNQRLRN